MCGEFTMTNKPDEVCGDLDPAIVELAKALARRLAREDYARMKRADSAKDAAVSE